jgi:hypothetical protein
MIGVDRIINVETDSEMLAQSQRMLDRIGANNVEYMLKDANDLDYRQVGRGGVVVNTSLTDMPGNEWFERETNKVVNCVDDLRQQTIGSESDYGQRSPKNLKTFTVTDQLKLTYPDAKVISMSIKDRSAILPGGHLSDGSYWYDFATGNFITSTFFKTELPNWVTTFNQEKQVDNYMHQSW